jgi:hypothetical protein
VDIPFENLISTIAHRLSPDLSKQPAGSEKIREAYQNQAIPYDERANLLIEGQQDLESDAASRRSFLIGQGVAGGAIAAGAGVRGFGLLGELGRDLDKARVNSKINLIEKALEQGVYSKPNLMEIITRDAAAAAGIRPSSQAAKVRALVEGPLGARHGNPDLALADLGMITKKRLASLGLTEFNNPLVSKAVRATTEGGSRSLWDQVSKRTARLLRSASRVGLLPGVRLGLAGAAIGTGAYLGNEIAKQQTQYPEDPLSLAEAHKVLRERDRQRALSSMPSIETPQKLKSLQRAAQSFPAAVSLADARKIEEVVGGATRKADASGHMKQPTLGATWKMLG